MASMDSFSKVRQHSIRPDGLSVVDSIEANQVLVHPPYLVAPRCTSSRLTSPTHARCTSLPRCTSMSRLAFSGRLSSNNLVIAHRLNYMNPSTYTN
jgi:hypothetical protein